MVYVTRGLVETLLGMAADAEPDDVTVSLAVTLGKDLPDADLDPETPVFTDFYLPSAGSSVNAVFGMDLGTPAGQTQGRFVSHTNGDMGVSELDDLHEVVFVGVPPWDTDAFGAFDRSGRKQSVTILDIEPPERSLTD